MALKLLRLNEEWEYQSKLDEGEEQRATFLLTTLSSRVLAKLQDDATKFRQVAGGRDDEAEATINQNQVARETVRCGLKKVVAGVTDADGKPLAWKPVKQFVAGQSLETVPDHVLDAFQLDWLRDLAEEIRTRSTLSEHDKGESVAQS